MSKHLANAHAASKKIAGNDQSDAAVDALANGTPVSAVMASFPDADWYAIGEFASLVGDPSNPGTHKIADAINAALDKQAA